MTAPWQIYFYIIPDTVNDEHIPFSLKWKNKDILYSIDSYFSNLLWKEKSISENITQFGNIAETCIEVHEQDGEYTVMVSIDLRKVTEEFLNLLCEFLKFKNALILTPDNKIRNGDYNTLLYLITNSEAARFTMYFEPYLAKRRDEYDYNRTYWWEKLVPEKRKLHKKEEIEQYIINFLKNN